LRQPEYRLRVDDFRVFYDVVEPQVHILAVIAKQLTYDWLEQHGIPL
jgi:mRNA-degrading endonuclease RelE of RelBE toxin-antitoxin system